MASCCSTDTTASSPKNLNSKTDESASPTLSTRLASVSPMFSALLGSSCCWLPTVLDLTSVGFVSVSWIHQLRPLFLALTLVLLLDAVRREGLSRRNLLRMLTSTLLMGLPQVIPIIQAKMGSAKPVASDGMHGMHGMEGMGMGMKHSCH